jgi:DNA-binding MarR family transcriptional regulator
VPIALSRVVKLDLPEVAAFVYRRDGAPSGQLLEELQQVFGCKRRAAQDALGILVSGGWLERRDDSRDARRKRYFLTSLGKRDLTTISGEREMRYARWRYSTTSTRARRLGGQELDAVAASAMLEVLQARHSTGKARFLEILASV